MDTKEKILRGLLCGYCNFPTRVVFTYNLYQKRNFSHEDCVKFSKNSYHSMLCENCGAYVGCHKHGRISKGRVAQSALRKLKVEAHNMFDILWRAKMEVSGASQVEARTAAYKWLSEVMKVPIEFAHIGMFDEEQCKQLIKICKPYCDKLGKR